MEGFGILLGLAALAALIFAPIGAAMALSRIRDLVQEIARLSRDVDRLRREQRELAERLRESQRSVSPSPAGPAAVPAVKPPSAPPLVAPIELHKPATLGDALARIAEAREPGGPLAAPPIDTSTVTPASISAALQGAAPASMVVPPPAMADPVTASALASSTPAIVSAPAPVAVTASPQTTVPAAATPPARPSPPPAPRSPVNDARAISAMEGLVGKRLMTWVGVGILFLGMAFFLKYAYDQDWLGHVFGPRARIGTVVAFGLGLMWFGRKVLGQGMGALGQGLLGGGLAALYLAVFGAFSPALMIVREPLLSPHAAFAGMALVTALGVVVALRHEAMAISIIAVLGGFAAPLLIGSGENSRDALFTYLLVMDLGVLAVALHRRWKALDVLTLAGTALLFAGWFNRYYHTYTELPNWGTLVWLGIFHVLFLLLPFAHHWRNRSPVTVARFALALANLAWSLGYACHILNDEYQFVLATVCLLLSAGYLAIGIATRRRTGDDPRVAHGFTALATMLLTLGLFYLLPVDGITVAWFVEASALLYIGHSFAYPPTRWAALVVLALSLGRVAVKHLPGAEPMAVLFWNERFLMQIMAPLGMAAFAAVHRWHRATGDERTIMLSCVLGAGLVQLGLATAEIIRHASGHPESWTTLPAASAIAWLWSFGALAYLGSACRWRLPPALVTGLLALVGAVIAALAAYLRPWAWSLPGLNPRFLTAVAVVTIAVCTVRALMRRREIFPAEQALATPITDLTQVLALVLVTMETATWMQRAGSTSGHTDLHWALTLVWLACAVAGALIGHSWNSVRMAGFGVVPLALGVGAAVTLYARDWGTPPLFANGRFLAGLLAVAAVVLHGGVLRRLLPGPPPWLRSMSAALLVLTALLFNAETISWCLRAIVPDSEGERWSCWSVAVAWLVAAVAGAAGWKRRPRPGLLETGAVFVQFTAIMALALYAIGWDAELMFINCRFLLVPAVIAALAWYAIIWRGRVDEGDRARHLATLFQVDLLVVLFFALSSEPASWFLHHIPDHEQAERLATFSVTVVWTLLASAWLAVGFQRHLRIMRLAALGLFALTAGKLLLMDMAKAQQLYRILAFFGVGIVFVGAAYAYHLMERRFSGGNDGTGDAAPSSGTGAPPPSP